MASQSGRADLLRVLASDQLDLLETAADLLGFVQVTAETRQSELPRPLIEVSQHAPVDEDVSQPLLPVLFWRLEQYRALSPIVVEDRAPSEAVDSEAKTSVSSRRPAEFRPLADWRALEPRMRQSAAVKVDSRALDLRKVVHRISRGYRIDRLPRKSRRSWGQSLYIVRDRSIRLVPFWRDQDLVIEWLRHVMPTDSVRIADYFDGFEKPVFEDGDDFRVDTPGQLVIVLGDLGSLANRSLGYQHYWTEIARSLSEAGCRSIALSPAPRGTWSASLRQVWEIVTWDLLSFGAEWSNQHRLRQAERLLTLLSPALRIEPGLLRAVRHLLVPEEANASTEADVWQHAAMIGRSSVAGVLDPKARKEFASAFAREPEPLRNKVLKTIKDWRAELPLEILHEELVSLDAESKKLASVRDDLPKAYEQFIKIAERTRREPEALETAETLSWFRRVEARIPERVWSDPKLQGPLSRLWIAAHQDEEDIEPPRDFLPGEIPSDAHSAQRNFHIVQQGKEFYLYPSSEEPSPTIPNKSHLASIASRNLLIHVNNSPFWDSGEAPPWADDWGEDEFGLWVTFAIELPDGEFVTQKMRWIPPGRFMMGSPEDEAERFEDESPQHEVTIGQGFWMFDTACIQALWQAVMGDNPSHFKGADRPVENVSFEDVAVFLERLNERFAGLDLVLPSEAQWEYACRAGTDAPFSFGANITTDQVNYAGFAPYAGAAEGEYRGQTVPVGSLPANPWGLFEMHGNVHEWCVDTWHESYEGAPADGSAWIDDQDSRRVVRGGSWVSNARNVRSAYRRRDGPGVRLAYLGFRCAGVQGIATPFGQGRGGKAERPPDPDRQGGASLLRLDQASPSASCAMPKASAFVIRTDVEALTFGRITRPEWASAMGRDQYGLWASIEVPSSDVRPLSQKMRWIGPGRFLMGSPEDEAGRFDGEGPRHEVTISKGFWLFDTPCTQAFWQAVMGENPSNFQSPTRPVEQVSFEDVQAFLEKIGSHLPGLSLTLPLEAQWEYACRAGTATATYAGDLEIKGHNNAPVLDPIAWYGGNSGVGFELENGYDSSDWEAKQYKDSPSGTHPVGKKLPNQWGLYDMLGNVLEWCEDGQRSYDEEPIIDPLGPTSPGTLRVVRGGSWVSNARHVRSAYRHRLEPGLRIDNLGFRCAGVQEES